MKKVSQQWDDMLLDYLDGKLDAARQAVVVEELRKNVDLQQRLQQLKLVDDALATNRVESPSKNFTSSVLSRLQHQPAKSSLSIKNSILMLLALVVMMSVAVILLSAGVFDKTTTVNLNDMSVGQKLLNQSLPQISIDGKWLVNAIILLNLVIVFLVLDRAILKPYFQRRLEDANLHSNFQ